MIDKLWAIFQFTNCWRHLLSGTCWRQWLEACWRTVGNPLAACWKLVDRHLLEACWKPSQHKRFVGICCLIIYLKLLINIQRWLLISFPATWFFWHFGISWFWETPNTLILDFENTKLLNAYEKLHIFSTQCHAISVNPGSWNIGSFGNDAVHKHNIYIMFWIWKFEDATLELWHFASYKFRDVGILEPWNLGSLELWNFDSLNLIFH